MLAIKHSIVDNVRSTPDPTKDFPPETPDPAGAHGFVRSRSGAPGSAGVPPLPGGFDPRVRLVMDLHDGDDVDGAGDLGLGGSAGHQDVAIQ